MENQAGVKLADIGYKKDRVSNDCRVREQPAGRGCDPGVRRNLHVGTGRTQHGTVMQPGTAATRRERGVAACHERGRNRRISDNENQQRREDSLHTLAGYTEFYGERFRKQIRASPGFQLESV